jgi:hypothetical protein
MHETLAIQGIVPRLLELIVRRFHLLSVLSQRGFLAGQLIKTVVFKLLLERDAMLVTDSAFLTQGQ